VVHSCLLCPCGCWWPQGIVLTAGIHHWFFDPSQSFDENQPCMTHNNTEPMKLFLVHTMLFVGSIWKNKSGWFLFVMSLWLLVA
jgi:hypothetical protein